MYTNNKELRLNAIIILFLSICILAVSCEPKIEDTLKLSESEANIPNDDSRTVKIMVRSESSWSVSAVTDLSGHGTNWLTISPTSSPLGAKMIVLTASGSNKSNSVRELDIVLQNSDESETIHVHQDVKYAQIADSKLEACILEKYDLNQDGQISIFESTKVTSLDCSGRGISSLEGIDNFPLTFLNCSDNNLKEIDFSKLPYLSSLNCDYNVLTSLNISNTNITTFTCRRNGMKSLDMSGCANLESFQINGNPLETINASNCPKLTTLNLADLGLGNVKDLNVSRCTRLTELNCSNSMLTSLNISGCSRLTKLNLYSNHLASLNLSECASLKELDCGDNELSSLDLSKCPLLASLNCSENNLKYLDVSACTHLYSLNILKNKAEQVKLFAMPDTFLYEEWGNEIIIKKEKYSESVYSEYYYKLPAIYVSGNFCSTVYMRLVSE